MFRRRFRWPGYVAGAALVAAATAAGLATRGIIAPANMVMLFLLNVVVIALRFGLGPALFTGITGVLAFDYFLVAPQLTLEVSDTQYFLTFLGLLITGFVISTLAARARTEAEGARQREAETAALYALAQDLTATSNVDAIADAVARHVGSTFAGTAAVFVREAGELKLRAVIPAGEQVIGQGPADWVLKHGRPAGTGASAHEWEPARYVPMRSSGETPGVLAVAPSRIQDNLSPAQTRLLEAFANQAAVALERAQLTEAARKNHLLEATERLQSALFNSLSHDLRTPLAAIMGAVSSLRDAEVKLDGPTRAALVDDIVAEAERLNRLVNNLLDMSRVEAGALRVGSEAGDIAEVIGAALEQRADYLAGRKLDFAVPNNLPPVPMSEPLITEVLVNLLDNAVKYSPPDAPIRIVARAEDGQVVVEVADRGAGIAKADLIRVFDKFYRVQQPGNVGGTGLGLAISKGIVEAHGGTIVAEQRAGGGTIFRFALPLPGRSAP